MAFLDAAKSLKAAAMTGTTVHNLTVTRFDVGHDHGPVSCGWEAPPGRRGRHMAGGASSCSAARHHEAEPLCTDRKVVERQCQTSSCRARSAGCGQAGLCASGSGGGWERCLVGRCGSAEQHGEHRQDGAVDSRHARSCVHIAGPAGEPTAVSEPGSCCKTRALTREPVRAGANGESRSPVAQASKVASGPLDRLACCVPFKERYGDSSADRSEVAQPASHSG